LLYTKWLQLFRRSGRVIELALLLALAVPAGAQTLPDSARATPAPADTVAAPAVAPAAGRAAGLPATEFETYDERGSGVRYTASLTGLYTTGTIERTFLSTSHTANFAFRGGRWRLPVGCSFR